MKSMSKGLLMTALLTGMLASSAVAFAAETEEFTLDPFIVTATRTEKLDIDNPATTKVITAEDIKTRGFKTVNDALEQTIGITSYSYAHSEGDTGSSTSRTYIRGLDKGTLILLNGAPINLNNYNSTSGIPVSAVEKIEIVKGSNSVLYGSEAMAGVINIITKKGRKNTTRLMTSAGNIEKKWEVSTEGQGYLISVGRNYNSVFNNANIPYDGNMYQKRKFNKTNVFASFNPIDKLTFNYMHTAVDNTGMNYLKPDGSRAKTCYSYDDVRDNAALIYNDKEHQLKSNLSFNRRRVDGTQYTTKGVVSRSGSSSNFVLYSINFDNSKNWKLSDNTNLLAGFTANKEKYEEIANRSNAISRDSLGVYLSLDQKWSERFSTIVGVRGHFVADNGFDGAHNVYLPQVQAVYKFDDNNSWYANVGKSFEMPAINSKFSRSKTGSNGALNPQEGWTYETGVKHITKSTEIKVAGFVMKMDDKFAWKKYKELGLTPPAGVSDDTYIQVNIGEFRNKGVEVEFVKNLSDKWQYNLGFTYQNPEAKDSGAWTQQSARKQFTAGVRYNVGKLNTGLNLFYSGDREDASKSWGAYPHNLRSTVKLNGMISYAPDKNNEFVFNAYNITNRDNVLNVSENLDRPYNWTVSYNLSF